ncbi:hypothetical protein ASPBRDRAFT_175875 [Aspergillus brasiliensis CBS 101740]|uniref:SET domain-containing protein n=1 Tax=Aspergillus brasiliensis (strain CBS 101740 / IMI 381727 / IBT 21946) TaxID=767769 RepID=A0A1L9ULN6_ASPBC|nr:hypothetical protein ASPBRDRAFT_175875 [Aspergillus brasiliensis CBS 101740]
MAAVTVSGNSLNSTSCSSSRSQTKRRRNGDDAVRASRKRLRTSTSASFRSSRSQTKQRPEGADADNTPNEQSKTSTPTSSQPSRSQTKQSPEGAEADSSLHKQPKTSSPVPPRSSQSPTKREQEGADADDTPNKRPKTSTSVPPQLSPSPTKQEQEGEDADDTPNKRPKSSTPAPPAQSPTKRKQEGEDADSSPNKQPKTSPAQTLRIPIPIEFTQKRDQILHAIMYDLYETSEAHKNKHNDRLVAMDYQARCVYASRAIEKALTCTSSSWDEANIDDDDEREARRLRGFAEIHGWPMLAICVQAEAFRRLCKEEELRMWLSVYGKLRHHVYNIWVQAHTRGSEWRRLLAPYAGDNAPPRLNKALAQRTEADKLRGQHLHELVIDEKEKSVRPPIFKGRLQKNIDASIFHPKDWRRASEPTLRGLTFDPMLREKVDHGNCDLCDNYGPCQCQIRPAPFEFVQLVQTATGVGVRALARFKKGDILGEFVGKIHPPCYGGDPVYALTVQYKTNTNQEFALVCPKEFGNFTRYINHSCNANTTFERRTIGDRMMMTVEAVRDIQPFEELKVNYGRAYWKGSRVCQCGEEGCYSAGKEKKRKERQERLKRRKQGNRQVEASKVIIKEEEDGDTTEPYTDDEDGTDEETQETKKQETKKQETKKQETKKQETKRQKKGHRRRTPKRERYHQEQRKRHQSKSPKKKYHHQVEDQHKKGERNRE